MSALEDRVNELEAKIAFQDDTIDILNDELKNASAVNRKNTKTNRATC